MDITKSSHQEWLDSIINVEDNTAASGSRSENQKRRPLLQRIHKVLPRSMLREKKEFEKYYAPGCVSIGPYHYHNQKLQQMNKMKFISARKLVSNNKQELDGLYKELFQMIKQFRDCYDKDDDDEINNINDFSDEAFTRMMLLDGCFILYYIKCMVEGGDRKLLQTHRMAFVHVDLFLLDNQLPFLVLEELMKNSRTMSTKYDWVRRMSKFIYISGVGQPDLPIKDIDIENSRPAHLLELLHKRIVGVARPESFPDWHTGEYILFTYRTVKELIAIGMQLSRSMTACLTDIVYEARGLSGRLRLPPIIVDRETKAKFLNLIAYEMCPDNDDTRWVSSYVCFLDSLIYDADDVKELRSAGILHNLLGTDNEVAKLFNEIGTDVVPDPFAYIGVKSDIQGQYNGLNYIAFQK